MFNQESQPAMSSNVWPRKGKQLMIKSLCQRVYQQQQQNTFVDTEPF